MARAEHIAVIAAGGDATAGDLHRRLAAAGIAEALVVDTRDGRDVHVVTELAPETVRALVADSSGGGAPARTLAGPDALRHLLRAAALAPRRHPGSSLNESHRRALEAGMIGDGLQRRLQLAYQVARYARGEALMQDLPVSIVASAVRVARSIHGDLSRARGLLIGAEEAGGMIAARLLACGLGGLAVMHERRRLAREVAESLGARAVPPQERERELARADILVLSAGTGEHQVTRADLEAAGLARRRKPVFIVDAGVPPDADPAIEELDDVFLYTLDHLERIALEDRRRPAEALVEEVLTAFSERDPATAGTAHAVAVRTVLEDARRRVLARAPDADAFEATRRLVDLLVERSDAVLADSAGADGLADSVRLLFGGGGEP